MMYNGTSTERRQLMDAVRTPTCPSHMSGVALCLQKWNHLIGMAESFGITLPDAGELIEVVYSEQKIRPALRAKATNKSLWRIAAEDGGQGA